MFGPRIDGRGGVALRPPTLDDYVAWGLWMLEPEATRFWAPRFGEMTPESAEARMKREGTNGTLVLWAIAYAEETVGFTTVFDIDWVRRDAETGIFIGRHEFYGRGIASEAVRLRTVFVWRELGLRRVHNWIAAANVGSLRANEKAGYRQMGLIQKAWFRSGEWYDLWLGEAFPATFAPELLDDAMDGTKREG